MKILYWLYNKFTPFKNIEHAKGERVYKLDSWSNAYFIGEIDDDGTISPFDGQLERYYDE